MKSTNRTFALRLALSTAAFVGATASLTFAAPMKIEAVLTPREQIRLDFADGSDHFVLMVKREGKATGQGPLAGTAVTEYGRHDIVPGVGGDPSDYLVFTATEGDIAYVKWSMRAVFLPGPDGKPELVDNGVWEIVGGTGKFKGRRVRECSTSIGFHQRTATSYLRETWFPLART